MAQAAVVNPANLIWGLGYLYGTISGGLADDVPFGALQNITLKDDIGLKKLSDPTQLPPIGVGISEETVQITAKVAKFRARQFKMLRGGTATFGTSTTYTKGVNDEPKVFNCHLKTPADGTDAELKVYGGVAPSLQVAIGLRDWSMEDFTAEFYGDGTKIYELILPGDQTTS